MILKSLSRRSDIGGLVKYILKDDRKIVSAPEKFQNLYVKGVHFTKQDLLFLEKEAADKALSYEQKIKFGNNVEAFVKYQMSFVQPTLIIAHNLRSRSISGFTKEFELNEAGRIHKRSGQIAANHVILSWSPKDAKHITHAMLKDVASQYIKLRGENTMVLGTLHIEAHLHLHLIVGATNLDGTSSRISKLEFAEIKQQLQDYLKEKYPMISHSSPEHGKAKNREKEVEKNIKTDERAKDKNQLMQVLAGILPQARSTEEFISLVQQQGHEVYLRDGRLLGIKYESERKFRFTNLGIDIKQFQELDIKKAKEEKDLAELRSIRRKEQNIEKIQEETIEEQKAEQTSANDLAEIRAKHTEKTEIEKEQEVEVENDPNEENSDTQNE